MFPFAMRITLISVSTTACLPRKRAFPMFSHDWLSASICPLYLLHLPKRFLPQSVSDGFFSSCLFVLLLCQIGRRVFEILTVFPWLRQAYILPKRLHKLYNLPQCSCFHGFPIGCKQSNVPILFLPCVFSAHNRICRILLCQRAKSFSVYRSLLIVGCSDTVCGRLTTSLRG